MSSASIQKACQKDSTFFLRKVLGVPIITPQQLQVCDSVNRFRRTAVPSGHGVGKTHLAARLALWRLYSFPGSKVITTAPTWTQVEMLLWRELRSAHKLSAYPLGGKPLTAELKLGEEWFAIGLSTNEPVRFQGHHAPWVTVIFDEATGVAPEIWEAAEGLAVSPQDRFIAIGNPTDPMSEFKKKCDSELWNVVRLNSEQHPNVLEDRIIIPGAVTKEWVEERVIDYGGRDSPLYRARVRGLFPEQGDDMLISLADVERAQARWVEPPKDLRPEALGTDVARYGSDETVHIDVFADGVVGVPRVKHGQDLMATAGEVKASSAERKAVDDSGLGGGVTDRLRELDVDVIPYIAGEKPFDNERFYNRRAESWWAIREALKNDQMALPRDNRLAGDLTGVKYAYTSKGQIKLESKDDVKKRLGRSPDRGDALVIAWYACTAPVFEVSEGERSVFEQIAFGG